MLFLLFTLPYFGVINSTAAETRPSSLEVEIHRLVNQERLNEASHGISLRKLQLQSTLIDVARAHSEDMLENNYFSHTNLEGEGPGDRVSDASVQYTRVAENLFRASGVSENQIAEDAVQGWIDSSGHYANMLSDTTYTGIGVTSQGGSYYITQVFVQATLQHMQDVGVVYDNDNLDEIVEEDEGFQIKTDYIIIGIVVLVIIFGLDAQRRNRDYYRGKYR